MPGGWGGGRKEWQRDTAPRGTVDEASTIPRSH